MEKEYWTECIACDTETNVIVVDSEELPEFCPMCGSPMTFEEVEDE